MICQTIPATNRRRILAVASRQTIGAEKNYDPRELEVGCTVWAVQHFRPWLLHRHFCIETDHANTRWVLDYGLDKHNSKLQRWSAQLSEFDFEFVWKCGESMIEPDTLSRAPLPADPNETPPLTSPMVTDMRAAAEKMLATPRPVDATPMSREKARVLVMERRKRAAQQQPRVGPTKYLAARKSGMKTESAPSAIVAKNSAFCPDRPPAEEEITTGLPMCWSSTPPPNPSRSPSGAAIWEKSSWRAGNTTDPTLFIIAHGISTDAMAAQELGVAVVGGSEVDPKLAAAFTKRTGAKSYPGLEELIEGGKRGLYPELHGLDIVTSGVPCPYRSNAGSLTSRKGKEKRKAGSERHLFEKQVEFFEIFRPRAAMIEQPTPSATHLAEYMKVIEGMQRIGYHCQHRVLNCSEHGDYTSRRRWIMIGFLHNGAVEWPVPLSEFEGLQTVLDDPKTVCLARIVPATEQFVARNARSPPDNMTANKLGFYRVHGVTDDRSVRVYDPAYPLPSATSTKSVLLGSPGGLVRTWIGDYQVSAFEVARAHGFTKEALAQVERLNSTDEQWKWVANSTPRRTVQALLSAILDALQSPRQLGIQDAGPITSQSDVAQCAASSAADSGLPMSTATEPELVSAVQRLVDAMPTKDELAALQAADPETKALLEWIRKGRAKKDIVDLPSKWRKEVKYLHLLEGVLFFRPVLDPHDELVDVPVLPSGLRRGALMAMHYDPLMCHPASKSLFALARKRYYWPGMSADCTKIVHGCGHCDRAKATQRMGIGMTKPMLFSQPFQRMSIDLVGPLNTT